MMKGRLTTPNHNLINADVATRLREAGIHPNKTLGQNFLVNAGIYEKIIAALELTSNDTVLEVGPGLGTLTDYLLAASGRVIAVEKDSALVRYLQKRYRGNSQIEIVHDDILKFDPGTYHLEPNTYKLVGNIPYYLTSHLIETIFETWPTPERLVFMLQREVAQRIVAKPPEMSPVRGREGSQRASASNGMSLLAVSVQYYARPEIIARVSRGSFLPPPNVDSAIIKLTPKTANRQALIANGEKFFKMVKAGFAGKRKQLVNNLSVGLQLDKAAATQLLQSSGIDPRRRAETLTLDEWQKLSDNSVFPS